MTTQTLAETHTAAHAVSFPIAAPLPLANPDTVRAIQASLREAGEGVRAHFGAETHLVKGYETAVNIRNFVDIVDEPHALGGTDLGPNPAELVLAALGACQEIVYSTYATLLNIPIERLHIEVSGDLDPRGFFGVADVPAGFESVLYEVYLDSPSSAEHVRELVRIVNQHCPVLDILQRALPVQGRVELNGHALE